jgi:hypothetical protein
MENYWMTEFPSHTGLIDGADVDVVILGAGFSACVTDREAPLMKGFFDRLDVSYPKLLDLVNREFKGCGQANVEEVMLCLDQVRTSPRSLLRKCISPSFHDETTIRRELMRYCLRRLCGLKWRPENWAAGFLAGVGDSTTVITVNYDNIAERILSSPRPGRIHFGLDANCKHCKMCFIAALCMRPVWFATLRTTTRLARQSSETAWIDCMAPLQK